MDAAVVDGGNGVAREESREGRGESCEEGRSAEGRGECVAALGRAKEKRQAGGGRRWPCVRRPRASRPSGERLVVTGTALWAGPHSSRPASWTGKRQVWFPSFLFLFFYILFCLF